MLGFGGDFRSVAFELFHADFIPNSTFVVDCPAVHCELVCLQNDPNSSGNILLGSERLAVVGLGMVLEPGDRTGFIPINNLNLIWHVEDDATTYLRYFMIGHTADPAHAHLLQENGDHILLEDSNRINLY